MKKILLAAVAALAIVGCAQNEEINNLGDKAEINFGTIVSKTTRAGVTDINSLKSSGFIVYAYNTGAEDAGTGKLNKVLMSGVNVIFENGAWKNDGTYYWPFTDKVQFFAYAADAAATNYAVAENATYPTVDYTVAATSEAQKDFVVAKLTNQTKKSDAIKLAFTHALTQVNFSAKGSNANLKYTITSIQIGGVYGAGTYSFDTETWTTTGTADGNYVYPTATDAAVSGTTATNLDQVNGALMLMPQTMTSAAKIKVSYKVFDGNDVQIDEVTDAQISLNETAAWGSGKKVRYTLTLSSEGATMSFEPEVGTWKSDSDDTPVTPPAA